LAVVCLKPALLSSTLGLEEEGLEEEGLEEEGLEEEGLEVCPQFGRWSPASVVVVVVDAGALVVMINRSRSTFAPPVSTKAKSLLPTPN